MNDRERANIERKLVDWQERRIVPRSLDGRTPYYWSKFLTWLYASMRWLKGW